MYDDICGPLGMDYHRFYYLCSVISLTFQAHEDNPFNDFNDDFYDKHGTDQGETDATKGASPHQYDDARRENQPDDERNARHSAPRNQAL